MSDSATPWTVICQAPLFMDFSSQEWLAGKKWLPFPSPGDLPDPCVKPEASPLQVDSLPSEPRGEPVNYA